MSALRWEQLHEDLDEAEALRRSGATLPDRRMASVEDDDPARGIVLGVAASIAGFWLPLAAVVAVRWAR